MIYSYKYGAKTAWLVSTFLKCGEPIHNFHGNGIKQAQ